MCSYDEINGKRLAFPIFIAASSPDSSITRIRSAFSYSSIMTSVWHIAGEISHKSVSTPRPKHHTSVNCPDLLPVDLYMTLLVSPLWVSFRSSLKADQLISVPSLPLSSSHIWLLKLSWYRPVSDTWAANVVAPIQYLLTFHQKCSCLHPLSPCDVNSLNAFS